MWTSCNKFFFKNVCSKKREIDVSKFCCKKRHGENEKARKEKGLEANWEGPYLFVGYVD
jgi:hypothetical protein